MTENSGEETQPLSAEELKELIAESSPEKDLQEENAETSLDQPSDSTS